jgi:hypothetical protein
LRDHGWIEGTTISIDYRWAEGRSDRLAQLAAELVQRNVRDLSRLTSSITLRIAYGRWRRSQQTDRRFHASALTLARACVGCGNDRSRCFAV